MTAIAGIVFIGIYKNKLVVKQSYNAWFLRNKMKAKVEMITPPSSLSDDLALFDKYLKMGDVIIFSASDPNFILPADIAPTQIKKVNRFNDLYFAVAMKSSSSIDLGVSTTFAGLLIADKNKGVWNKWVEIKDQTDDRSLASSGNNPYYFWNNEKGEIYLAVVDQNGAGSGEGNLKLYQYLHQERNWNLNSCYYTGNCQEPDGEFGCTQKIERMKKINSTECQKYLPELVVYNN